MNTPLPIPPDERTLTPEERRLCFFYAVLWIGAIALAVVFPQAFFAFVRDMAGWISRQIESLLNGELPDFSVATLFVSIYTSFLIGAAILGAIHFAWLVKVGRWMRPVTLWFWTMLHALLPVLLVLVLIVDNIIYFIGTGHSRRHANLFPLLVFFSGLPLYVAFASRRLWRRRKSAGAG